VLGTIGKALPGQGLLQQCEVPSKLGRGEHSSTVRGGVVGLVSKPEALEAQLRKFAATRV
jgi:hypothetical protein